jgi:hypothetical protein
LHERTRGDALLEYVACTPLEPVNFSSLEELPPPVSRYFMHVLPKGQHLISKALIQQSGMLRTTPKSNKWLLFDAHETIVPTAKGFVWNARIKLPLGMHLRVLDSGIAGVGSGRVSFLSVFPVAAEEGTPQLNAGALHRYLAEAVWCPTALLPQSGVTWTAIDDRSALATLCVRDIRVSLKFRFNKTGEVAGIYTPGRFARIGPEYQLLPWEGHFDHYQLMSGIRVPSCGEVGWHVDGRLEIVWKGEIVDIQYDVPEDELKG